MARPPNPPNKDPRRERRPPPPAGPAPTRAKLHEAALAHLARFSATEAGLVRVLDRRIDRWARRAAAEAPGEEPPDAAPARAAAREVARALVQSGVVDDAAYAAGRARSLTRAGRSRRAIGAHLSMKGVPQEVAHAAMPEPEAELAAALAYARRRRLGPFRRELPEGAELAEVRRKEIGALARAGFPQPVAQQALRMDRDEAELAVIGLKQS
jgi:regulatory protein